MSKTVSEVFNVPVSHILRKERRKQKGESQYEKSTETSIVKGRVQEQGQLFNVDLSSYIDTGLFFDHRPLRAVVRNSSSGKAVLNLFCYTGSFSVYAAEGNAKSVESVDLSNTYLNWAKENMKLCGLENNRIRFIVDDVIKFLEREKRRVRTYHGIIMDPPSYGRGPKGEIWKIEESIHSFIKLCSNLLSDNPLFFLVNSYTTGLAPAVLTYMISTEIVKPFGGHVESEEIGLPVKNTGLVLPCGASGRWSKE